MIKQSSHRRVSDEQDQLGSGAAAVHGVAYEPARRAAQRAFKRWPERKRDDAEGEFMAKMWDQWKRLLERGKDPEPLLYPLIHWAKQWCYQDRRLSGRPRNLDISDFRADGSAPSWTGGASWSRTTGQQGSSGSWTGTRAARTDDPADLAAPWQKQGSPWRSGLICEA